MVDDGGRLPGVLDDALADVARRFAGVDRVPRSLHWGGWRIVPDEVEFWQATGPDRMHDRLRFEADWLDRTWRVRRLGTVITGRRCEVVILIG